MEGESAEFMFPSAVCGFHVYHRTWGPLVAQRLCRETEHDNPEDRFAVAVVKHTGPKSGENSEARATVGHLPQELSQALWYFLLHGGETDCKVTGRRQCSPLIQGELEIPVSHFMIGGQGKRSSREENQTV